MRHQGAVVALCVTLLAVHAAGAASWSDSDSDSNRVVRTPASWWRGGGGEVQLSASDNSDSDGLPPRWALRDDVYDDDSERRVYSTTSERQSEQQSGECACTCQHCDATYDSDSDSDSDWHHVLSSDASDASDDSDAGLSLERSSDSDGSDGSDGSDRISWLRRLLQKLHPDEQDEMRTMDGQKPAEEDEEEQMRALGSDGSSDGSDDSDDSERHVDLSSDGSDVSDADEHPCAPCNEVPGCGSCAPAGGTLPAGDCGVGGACDVACGACEPCGAVLAANVSNVECAPCLPCLPCAECDACNECDACPVMCWGGSHWFSSDDSDVLMTSDQVSDALTPPCVQSCAALTPVLYVLDTLDAPPRSWSPAELQAAYTDACTAIHAPAAVACLEACPAEVQATAAGLATRVCDVNATLGVDPCGCDCPCGPPPPSAGIVVNWTMPEEPAEPVTPSRPLPTEAPSSSPSSSPSTATPTTTSPTTSPTSAAPTGSPSVVPTTLAPSTAAPTGGDGGSDSDRAAATSSPTTPPTVPQDTLVSATMTLAQLDFAEFADAAFNASFRANYTQDMATAAQVPASAVKVVSITAGSTVVDTQLRFTQAAGAAQFSEALQADPAALLANSSIASFGTITASNVQSQLVTPLPATASPTPAPWSQWYPPPPPVSPTAAPKSSTVVEGMSNLTFYLIVFIGGGVVLLCMCVGCCRLPMPARTTVTAESGAVPPGARVYVPVDRPRSSKPASSTMEEGEEWDPSPRLDLSKERGPMRSSFARALLGQAPPAGAPLPPEKLRQSWFDILSV